MLNIDFKVNIAGLSPAARPGQVIEQHSASRIREDKLQSEAKSAQAFPDPGALLHGGRRDFPSLTTLG
jgi:hypothetical protein